MSAFLLDNRCVWSHNHGINCLDELKILLLQGFVLNQCWKDWLSGSHGHWSEPCLIFLQFSWLALIKRMTCCLMGKLSRAAWAWHCGLACFSGEKLQVSLHPNFVFFLSFTSDHALQDGSYLNCEPMFFYRGQVEPILCISCGMLLWVTVWDVIFIVITMVKC